MILGRIRRALLAAHEVRVIPWPGWDDDEALPPVWDLDDWRPIGVQSLQGGVRGVVAWRRVPRWERVLRAIRDAVHQASTEEAPRGEAAPDEPEFGESVRVRSPLAGRAGLHPPGWE